MILKNAIDKINRYNQLCVHYNLVAESIYRARDTQVDLFGIDFLPFLVAGLISFDLGRMMGSGSENRYDPAKNGFARKLLSKLQEIRQRIHHLIHVKLTDIDLDREQDNISLCYHNLSCSGADSLNQRGDDFHVGATKIMHFINPELFIIVDSNSARALRMSYNVRYHNTTQPGYSDAKYIESLSHAQVDIRQYGVTEFCSLETGTPMARIYDKLSFATGSDWL